MKGYRTYLTVGLGAVATVLHSMHIIPDNLWEAMAPLLTFLGLGFLRAAGK